MASRAKKPGTNAPTSATKASKSGAAKTRSTARKPSQSTRALKPPKTNRTTGRKG